MKWYENPIEFKQFEIDNFDKIAKFETDYDWENMKASCEITFKDKSKHVIEWTLEEKYYPLSGNKK